MKPFNLEEALAGKPVVNRQGDDVKVICVLRGSCENRVLAIQSDKGEDIPDRYYPSGTYYPDIESHLDLFMKPTKPTKHTKYTYIDPKTLLTWDSPEEVTDLMKDKGIKGCVVTKVEWDE